MAKTRFDKLIDDINSSNRNLTGKTGEFIKFTEHSKNYNKKHNHKDYRGSKWYREAMKQVAKNRILKYKTNNYYVWWVIPGHEKEFEKWIKANYPNLKSLERL